MKDRARKRREYISRIRRLEFGAGIGGTIVGISGLAYLCVLVSLIEPIPDCSVAQDDPCRFQAPLYVPIIPLGLASIGLTFGWLVYTDRTLRANAIPYVPSARELVTLPPDEILVRGSAQPPSIIKQLLRSAQDSEMEPHATLLRSYAKTGVHHD